MTVLTTRTTQPAATAIEAARIERGMSKSELARRMGMDRAMLSKAIHGHRYYRLSEDQAIAAAKVLGIPDFVVKSWLLSDTPTQAA